MADLHDSSTYETDVEQGPRPAPAPGPPSQPYGPPPPGYARGAHKSVHLDYKHPKLACDLSTQRALAALDLDKNGRVSTAEILAAANALQDAKTEKRFLRRVVVLVTVVMAAALVGVFGVTYLALEVTKEARVAQHTLVAGDGGPVQVASSDLVADGGELRARKDGAAVKTLAAESRVHLRPAPAAGRRLAAGQGLPLAVSCEEASAALRDHERAAATPLSVELWPGTQVVVHADASARLGEGFELRGRCDGGECDGWVLTCPAETDCECAVAVTGPGWDAGADGLEDVEGLEGPARLLQARRLGLDVRAWGYQRAFCAYYDGGAGMAAANVKLRGAGGHWFGLADASGACAVVSNTELYSTFKFKVGYEAHPCSQRSQPEWCEGFRAAGISKKDLKRILPGSGAKPGGDQWRIDFKQSGVMSSLLNDPARSCFGEGCHLAFGDQHCETPLEPLDACVPRDQDLSTIAECKKDTIAMHAFAESKRQSTPLRTSSPSGRDYEVVFRATDEEKAKYCGAQCPFKPGAGAAGEYTSTGGGLSLDPRAIADYEVVSVPADLQVRLDGENAAFLKCSKGSTWDPRAAFDGSGDTCLEPLRSTYGYLEDQAVALKQALANGGRHPCAVPATGFGWCAGKFDRFRGLLSDAASEGGRGVGCFTAEEWKPFSP